MSGEIVKADLPVTGPKPIPLALFVPLFLIGGFALTIVIMLMLSCIMVLMAFAVPSVLHFFIDNNLRSVTWLIVVGFSAIWWPLNYYAWRLFVQKYSELGGAKRFLAACLLTISALPFPLFMIFVMAMHSSVAGWSIPVGWIVGIIAQLIEVRKIYMDRNLPLSAMAVLPKSQSKREIAEKHLEELQVTKSQSEFDRLVIAALNDFGISKFSLKTTSTAPIEVLTAILVNQKKHAVADSVTKNYLEIIERE